MEILTRACQQVASWRSEERVDSDFVVSVNVSALQIVDDRFAKDVAQVLRETSLPAANLLLEITERHAVDQEVSVEPLKALGVRLAVDDFGEGYGCLAYLRRMPVDVLKVERSFVTDLPQSAIDQVLMGSMLELADGLARELIAEGVESVQQLRALRELGCQLAQGYLFGKPVPADELAQAVACRHPRMRWLQLAPALSAESTAASNSAPVNGFDRNGVSLPTAPLVTRTSSR
jgi:EAL domain-containing protein (putative c-di-GMP-specific phosphodiesterase class I)